MKKGNPLFSTAILLMICVIIFSSFAYSAAKSIHLVDEDTVQVALEDTIDFRFNQEDYRISVDEMYTYSVGFTITGKLTPFLLHDDESVVINLDDFDGNDVRITATDIVPRKKATLHIESINSPVPIRELPFSENVVEPENQSPQKTEEKTEPVETQVIKEITPEEPAYIPPEYSLDEQKNQMILYLLMGLIIAAASLGGYIYIEVTRFSSKGVSPKLVRYVERARAFNTSEDSMRQSMKQNGWNERNIEIALRSSKTHH